MRNVRLTAITLVTTATALQAQNVGIGTASPASKGTVSGNVSIGSGYAGIAAPANGLIVEGKVGIGTSTIASFSNLHVHSTTTTYAMFTNTGTGATNTDGFFVGTNSFGNAFVYNNEAGSIQFGTSALTRMFLDLSGNLGIGTASPASRLAVSGNITVGASYAAIAAPTNGMIVEGQVGIGTSSPSATAKLHVALGTSTTDGVLINGTYNSSGSVPDLGAGTRLMFYPGKSAFRAGRVTGTQWDDANVGDYSTAIGYNTTASGDYSFAAGNSSTASAINSVAMGGASTASGNVSFALGTGTASGSYAVATGIGTSAAGEFATAMGTYTDADAFLDMAIGRYNVAGGSSISWFATDPIFEIGIGTSVASRANAFTVLKGGNVGIGTATPSSTLDVVGTFQYVDGTQGANEVLVSDASGNASWTPVAGLASGTLDQAYDFGGAGAGRTITATDGVVSVQGEDGFEVTGTFGSGDLITTSGAGTRMFFNPRKAAFRAGSVSGAQWNDASVGQNSTALGLSTTASGFNSLAIGQTSTASGGEAIALGSAVTASGTIAIAMGQSTTASGEYSMATGNNTFAESGFETVLGRWNTDYVPTNTAGWSTTDRLLVVGNGTASGSRSDAMVILKNGNVGIGTSSPNTNARLHVDLVTSTTDGVLVSGTYNASSTVPNLGAGSRMMFYPGKAAFRAGRVTGTQWDDANVGDYSTAMGYIPIASGIYSTSLGTSTTASGYCATALGTFTTASGQYSTAMGDWATASGDYSTAMGYVTEADAFLDMAIGRYNLGGGNGTSWVVTDPLFEVGNGANSGSLANAFTILKGGNIGIARSPTTTYLVDVDADDWTRAMSIDHDQLTNVTTYGINLHLDHGYTGASTTTAYGVYSNVSQTATASDRDTYAGYFIADDNQTGTGTRITRGMYANASTASTSGTTTTYAVYATQSGNGDTEYGGYFNGDVYTTGAYLPSDEMLKSDLGDYEGAVDALKSLAPVTYAYRTDELPHMNLPEGTQIGFTAQNMEQTFPGLVKTAVQPAGEMPIETARVMGYPYKISDENPDMVVVGEDVEFKAVNYTGLVPVLVRAVQEQQAMIEQLKQQNAQQQAEIDLLKDLIRN